MVFYTPKIAKILLIIDFLLSKKDFWLILRLLLHYNFTTQKSLRIIFFGILHPQNCKNLIFCNFLELSHIFGQWSKDQKLNFLQFLGYRIPKNIILRLFCVVKFFDISPLSSIKHPKNHIFAKYQTIFSPWTTFWVGVL